MSGYIINSGNIYPRPATLGAEYFLSAMAMSKFTVGETMPLSARLMARIDRIAYSHRGARIFISCGSGPRRTSLNPDRVTKGRTMFRPSPIPRASVNGFTLAELLVVIAIIGIVAAL